MDMRSFITLVEDASGVPALGSIHDVEKAAKKIGVDMQLEYMHDERDIHLTWIERKSDRKGAGVEAMQLLLDYADRTKKRVVLVAKDEEPALIAYYMSFGFKDEGLMDDGTYMVRRPRRQKRALSENETKPSVIYHVSPATNRASIKRRGLLLQNTEFPDVQREPGVHCMQTFEQARDWAFFFMLDKGEKIDIWKVSVPDGVKIVRDPSDEMQETYDAWVIYAPVAASDLELVFTQPVRNSTRYAPPLARKVVTEGSDFL
jgi:hypothetical protein